MSCATITGREGLTAHEVAIVACGGHGELDAATSDLLRRSMSLPVVYAVQELYAAVGRLSDLVDTRTAERDAAMRETVQTTTPRIAGVCLDLDATDLALLGELHRRLTKQDTRATAHPLYVVQMAHRAYGIDPSHHDPDGYDYFDEDGDRAAGPGPGIERVWYDEVWVGIKSHLTQAAADEWIVRHRHNYPDGLRVGTGPEEFPVKVRDYVVESQHGAHEWIGAMKALRQLCSAVGQTEEAPKLSQSEHPYYCTPTGTSTRRPPAIRLLGRVRRGVRLRRRHEPGVALGFGR